MNIQTMAVQVNKKTYSIAVACLGAQFAARPIVDVQGGYLVINKVDDGPLAINTRYGRTTQGPANIVLVNEWFSAEDFKTLYSFDKRRNQTDFFEIEKKAERSVLYRRISDEEGEQAEPYAGEDGE